MTGRDHEHQRLYVPFVCAQSEITKIAIFATKVQVVCHQCFKVATASAFWIFITLLLMNSTMPRMRINFHDQLTTLLPLIKSQSSRPRSTRQLYPKPPTFTHAADLWQPPANLCAKPDSPVNMLEAISIILFGLDGNGSTIGFVLSLD